MGILGTLCSILSVLKPKHHIKKLNTFRKVSRFVCVRNVGPVSAAETLTWQIPAPQPANISLTNVNFCLRERERQKNTKIKREEESSIYR